MPSPASAGPIRPRDRGARTTRQTPLDIWMRVISILHTGIHANFESFFFEPTANNGRML